MTSDLSPTSSEATIPTTTLTPNITGNDTSSTNETLTESSVEPTTPIPSIETAAKALQVVGSNETDEVEAIDDPDLEVDGTNNGTRLIEDDDWPLNGTYLGAGNSSTEDEGNLVEHILSVGDGSNEILDNSNASNDSASSTPVNDNLIQVVDLVDSNNLHGDCFFSRFINPTHLFQNLYFVWCIVPNVPIDLDRTLVLSCFGTATLWTNTDRRFQRLSSLIS